MRSEIPLDEQLWSSSAAGRSPRRTLPNPCRLPSQPWCSICSTLEESGLIRTTKIGRVRTCRIEPAGLEIAQQWIAKRRSLWERRLDRLGAVLAAERK